jgi:predicted MFS family arabinose efflux permease
MTDAASPSTRRLVSGTAFLLLFSALVLSISTGLRQSIGLFLPPFTELGLSSSAFSFAIALQSIIWGMSQPFVGMLADRYGARPVLTGGALLYAGGLAVMAQAGSALGLDIGAGLLAGIGIAGTNMGVLIAVVSRAVPLNKRSQTVGTVAALGSLGTLVLAPFGQFLIDTIGWRNALLVFAGIAALIVVVAATIGRGEAEAVGRAPEPADDRTLGQVLRQAATHPGYLAMTAAFFACGFQLMYLTVHLPTYLVLCGLPATLGASAIGVIGLFNTLGSWAVGQLGARYSQKRLLALIYLLRTVAIGAFLALPISPASTLVFAAVMGFLWLSVAPLVSGLVGRVFGLKYFSTLYGFVFLSHQVGSFLGVMLGGASYDLTGGYFWAWVGMIAIGLTAFLLQWPMDDRTPAERAAARAPDGPAVASSA